MTLCKNGIGYGPELYNEIRRLIHEWNGSDASERSNSIPQLVERIVKVREGFTMDAAQTAAHDEAAAA